jgi:hypothetical protein
MGFMAREHSKRRASVRSVEEGRAWCHDGRRSSGMLSMLLTVAAVLWYGAAMKLMMLFVLTTGCAAMEAHDAAIRAHNLQVNCQYDEAYSEGMNDGKNRADMDMSYYEQCPPELMGPAKQGYRDGYDKGLASTRPQNIVVIPAS